MRAGLTRIVGIMGQTSAFLNVNLSIAAIARSGNVVTVTTAGNMPVDLNGLTLTVAGVADSSYNGSFAVTTTGPNTLTYAETGANSTSSGGNVSYLTGGYALYPMAEVLGVYNATTKQVDGQMTLAANNVAWAPSDVVEMPHYFQENVSADTQFVNQTTPRPEIYTGVGVVYESERRARAAWMDRDECCTGLGVSGQRGHPHCPGLRIPGDRDVGRDVRRAGGRGRTCWRFIATRTDAASGTPATTCSSWIRAPALDTLAYQPQSSILNMNMRGATYGFTPQAFTAGTVNSTTINATTVNATTLNGALSADAVAGVRRIGQRALAGSCARSGSGRRSEPVSARRRYVGDCHHLQVAAGVV